MGSSNTFRPNAGVVIVDHDGQVLAFRRTGTTDAWQYPQGGIDDGESALEAMWRELGEETGLTDKHVELVAELPEWIGYEIPEQFRTAKTKKKMSRGQVQRWFYVRLLDGQANEIASVLDALPPEEFDGWKWTDPAALAAETIEFRQPIYERVLDYGRAVGLFA